MTELTCKELVELVTDYFDAALAPEERARFEEHLASCGYCRLYVDQIQTTIDITGKLNAPSSAPAEAAPALKEDVLRLFREWKQGRQ